MQQVNISHFKGLVDYPIFEVGWNEAIIDLILVKIRVMKIQLDHIKHFCVCFAVSLTASSIESGFGASYGQSCVAGLIAGGAIGVGKEYGDKCAPDNKWNWSDIIADMAGAIIGSVLGSLFSMIKH